MSSRNQPASKGWVPKEEDIVLFLSALRGVSGFARDCYRFYTERPQPKELPDTWPWSSKGGNVRHLQWLIPQVPDDAIRELCQSLVIQSQKLDELNEQWGQALASFLKLPPPRSESDLIQLRKRLDAYRKKNGAAWASREEFQPLVEQTRQVAEDAEQIWPQLHSQLLQVYPHTYGDLVKTHEGFGDQRAKDIIDRAYEVDAQSAVRLLQSALRYGHTGIQASKAYRELGNRYHELGDAERAIENYTKSLEAWEEPNWMALFYRGELYYQQGRWKEAREDLQRALAIQWMDSPERERAEEHLLKLDAMSGRSR